MIDSVLVIDHTGRFALRIEPWQKAITDLFKGKVEVVEYSNDRTIRGVTQSYPMPSIVRILRRFKRERVAIKFSRLNIYARDNFTCLYCNVQFPTEELTFDHVVPKSRGGRTEWTNIVTCCVSCNKLKADRTLEQTGMTLLRRPRKPTFLPVITVRGMNSRDIPDNWRPYWISKLEG